MLFLLFGLLAIDEDVVQFRDTGIFEPISRNEVAITAEGHVYMLNFQERFIRHWNPEGKVVNTFGRKGKGPGELNFAEGFFLEGDRLYINDMGNEMVHSFHTDGTFIESMRPPSRGLTLAKVEGGWATANFMSGLNTSQKVTITLTDARLENGKEVLSWSRTGTGGNIVVRRGSSGTPKVPYNPVAEEPFMAVGPDGRYLYICHPGVFKISVIDTREKKVVHTIDRDDAAIPFNEEFGNEQLQKLKDNREAGGHMMQIEFEPNYPAHFPIVRNFYTSGEGLLVVEKWTGQPETTKNNLLLDRQGNDRKVPYNPANARRVVAIRGNYGYATLYDEDDDEGYLVKTPLSQLDGTIDANPITAQRAPRMLMRMN